MLEQQSRPQSQTFYDHETSGQTDHPPLPSKRLERVSSWGGATHSLGYVYRPATLGRLRRVFEVARESRRTVGLRGAGNSYGDAALNEANIVLDLRRMNRILDYEPDNGRIRVQPGVTIAQLWQHVIEDGWWPTVVPGTSKPTIGGCAGMNIHGKNAWRAGTIGDHIEMFDLLLPSGEVLACSRDANSDLFHAAIGGLGMLGVFTSITLRLKRIYSGLISVEAYASRNLAEMIQQFEQQQHDSDYLVGWIDAFGTGKALGRGQIHRANYLAPGADPYPQQTLRLDRQHLPDTLFGIVPRSMMWRFMRPFMNNVGARLVNLGKYTTSRIGHGSVFQQPHVAFHFLLDYIPDWKKSYGTTGLIQYQSFVPQDRALDAFGTMLTLCQRHRLPSYLAVFKKHRTDDFLLSHGVDGYSLALDFKVTRGNRQRLATLCAELDEIVLNAGGRFYLAKDSTLRRETLSGYLGQDVIQRFKALKEQCDPETRLETNMWRRLFAD
ncbi:MAG: FAD-binding oxidoreductase [Candidatus Promineifilaceae bacterium]|nr:FAD-binding oxidoreductase [Candidatus Promineifilaceae bacterium]